MKVEIVVGDVESVDGEPMSERKLTMKITSESAAEMALLAALYNHELGGVALTTGSGAAGLEIEFSPR